ncbi:hypothetical protein VRK_10590 [Vibrio sp. MEBiC08052]|nr:hypothetical protein VRK_10590 [Vibrio sp. MEBiC08052]
MAVRNIGVFYSYRLHQSDSARENSHLFIFMSLLGVSHTQQ